MQEAGIGIESKTKPVVLSASRDAMSVPYETITRFRGEVTKLLERKFR